MELPSDDLPARHPLGFAIGGAELVFPPRAGARIWAFGKCPDLADLIGWTLVAAVHGSRLTFLGFHPDLCHEGTPCVRFFTVAGLPPALIGALDATGEIDVVVMDDRGRIAENFRFTTMRRADLLGQPRPEGPAEEARMAR